MRRLFAAIGACGLAWGAAAADPAPPAPSVSELIDRLGSGDFRTREAATADLLKVGPSAIPALREAVQSDDPEVRQRAGGVLFRLQRISDSQSLLAPKRITLDYRGTPLGTAVSDLSHRTGVKIVLDPTRVADPLRTVTLATGEVPLWEALERFCAAAGLEEAPRLELEVPKQPQNRRGFTMPQPPPPDQVPVVLIDGKGRWPGARDSAVRVVALPKSFPGHRVSLDGETTLCFDVAPAPGLNWQEVVGFKVTKLIDDAGRPGGGGMLRPAPADGGGNDVVVALAPPGLVGGPGFALNPGFNGRFDPRTGMPIPPESFPNPRVVSVPLKLGTPTAKTIKRIEGYVLGEVQIANQTLLTLTDPAKRTGQTYDAPGQVRVTVQSVREAKEGVVVQVTLQYPSPWAVSARRGFNPGGLWPEPPRAGQGLAVKAFDAKGQELAGTAGGHSDSSDDGQTLSQYLTITYRKAAAAPAKLTLVGPRPVIVEVPFALDNVPLP